MGVDEEMGNPDQPIIIPGAACVDLSVGLEATPRPVVLLVRERAFVELDIAPKQALPGVAISGQKCFDREQESTNTVATHSSQPHLGDLWLVGVERAVDLRVVELGALGSLPAAIEIDCYVLDCVAAVLGLCMSVCVR